MLQPIELLTRTLCDTTPTHPAEIAFLFGQTVDNQESVLKQAESLLKQRKTQQVSFLQSPALSGYPGFESWKGILLTKGISESQITGIPFDNLTMIHTRIEAEALIRYAKQQNIQTIYILAAPFHQLRAFMTAVTLAVELYPTVKLYSMSGTPLDWQQNVAHSQGQVLGSRSQLIAGELERIEKYIQKGDLGTYQLVLDYLNQRDRIV
uniref:YdcF family protein n=1 Tax=Xanthocytophaga agilis TaxID=3048010 RepID=A0AAE3R3Y6_9BACT|nr:YdcF family protein [Xanthocytophaga agilis]MDJ1500965.1 YdcF family protein [Xanthocytophaga agilis]